MYPINDNNNQNFYECNDYNDAGGTIPTAHSAEESYQPDFVMRNWNGEPSKPKKPAKMSKKRNWNKKPIRFAAGAVAVVMLSFGFGYWGSSLALRQNESSKSSQTTVVKAGEASSSGSGSKTVPVASTTSNSGNSSIDNVVSAVANSVVEIRTESVKTGSFFQQQIVSGAGSGVVVTADGYIATNNHVISGSSKITVTLKNSKKYTATLVGTDKTSDLAVIKINATGLEPVVFGKSSTLKVGQTAIVIGNPLGELGGSVTRGIISALSRSISIDGQEMNLMQTDAAINPGNSGGGLFNAAGQLVGIVNAKSAGSGIEGLGFAIPIDTAQPVIKDLIAYGYVKGRVDLGMSLVDVDDAESAMMYEVSSLGVYVSEVASGSNAARAGIQSGDRIVSIGGTEVNSTTDVNSVLNKHSVGDKVVLVIDRDGQQGKVAFTLQEYKGSRQNT